MKYLFLISILSFLLFNCSSGEVKFQTADEVLKADKINGSKIYYNPVSADKPLNKDEAAKMSFDKTEHNFGTIKEGQVVQHLFKFKNTGKAPLVITNASGTCGCTVPEWSKEPILPGKSGEIKVSFDSKGKSGKEEKEVYVMANTIPNKTTLSIKSLVLSKQ
jgi:hypothetical protein